MNEETLDFWGVGLRDQDVDQHQTGPIGVCGTPLASAHFCDRKYWIHRKNIEK